VRALVRPVLEQFAAAPAHRALVQLAWQHDEQGRINEGMRLISERIGLLLQPWAAAQGLILSPDQIWLATRAVVGTVRFASLERSPLLDTPLLEEGLVRLALTLLDPGGCRPGGR
jgi:hypothetical protein